MRRLRYGSTYRTEGLFSPLPRMACMTRPCTGARCAYVHGDEGEGGVGREAHSANEEADPGALQHARDAPDQVLQQQ